MKAFASVRLEARADGARWVLRGAFVVLISAFFTTQIIQHQRYSLRAADNRLRAVPLTAPRGLILDRNGRVIAENVPGYAVKLLAPDDRQFGSVLDKLRAIVPVDSDGVAAAERRFDQEPFLPALVIRDATLEQVASLEERRSALPGLVIQSEPKRYYPDSTAVAHLVGYVAEVTDADLASKRFEGVRLGTLVGRSGLELAYDSVLRGTPGMRYIEVNARNRLVREDGAAPPLPPVAGVTLHTTVDLPLQLYIDSIWPAGVRGAMVAMTPDGQILALYSAPTYNPNDFIGGISNERWTHYVTDRAKPLLDRAIQARYPPASPFKLAIAAMALRRGIVTLHSHMPEPCTGSYFYGDRAFGCWKHSGHGDLDLTQAIAQSCDVYFYQLGLKLGLEPILTDGVLMGFRDRSGIDLMNEVRPRYPSSTAYFDKTYGSRGWSKGVTLNMAIGQGENSQTLVNMMRFYAALAGNGTAAAPYLVRPDAGAARDLGLSASQLLGLRRALELVVDQGTAAASRSSDLEVAGKTGTAQNPHGQDHGWFIGFAPADHPTIIVGAIMEFAEHGTVVAPYVVRVIRRYVLGAASDDRRGIRVITTDEAPAAQVIAPVPDSVAEDTTTFDVGDTTDADTTGGGR
ncbi:MAG: penicillin-binding protein 2 [Gemmatimonadales bacterium]